VRLKKAFETALVRVKAVVRDLGKETHTQSCFISYAWGEQEQERWVERLAGDLQNAGIEVILDQNDNSRIGASIARFMSRIEGDDCDYVLVIGTPRYLQKYENKLSDTGSKVAAEVDLINLRLMGTEEKKETVLPLLLDGDERNALPPLLRGRVFADFRNEALYFAGVFDLILTLYHIPFHQGAVKDLREVMRGGEQKRI
jgi:hypothetical protein